MLARMLNNLRSRAQYRYALLVCFIVSAIYYLNNFVLGRAVGGFVGNYILPSLLWGLLAVIISKLPTRRAAAKPRFKKMFCWLAFMGAAACIMVGYAVGLLQGLGRSPYDLSVRGILVNIFYLGFMVGGMELSRAWFLNVLFRKRPALGVILTSLTYSFFWFSPNAFMNLDGGLAIAKFIGSVYLPALSENVLASYLAFWGGMRPAIIYRGTVLACRWFIPILPNLSWIIQAMVGTFAPTFAAVLIHQVLTVESSRCKRNSGDTGSPLGWIVTSGICVLTIWFSVGVFSYFPSAIVSGSMSPEIAIGDVVIVKKEPAASVDVGDVIMFREDNIRIAHRVVEIGMDEAGREFFWTKGDANKSRDTDPVFPEQVIGQVVYTIPKAGWLTIWMRSRSS